MRLVILFGLIILLANWMGAQFGQQSLFGLQFGAGAGILALLLPLRDIIQERHNRLAALLTILVSCVILYFVRDGEVARALAASLFWTEILDFGVYTSLRNKLGAGWAMIVSDIISAPATPLMYYWLMYGNIGMPDGQLVVKYTALFLFYLIFFGFLTKKHYSDFNLQRGGVS